MQFPRWRLAPMLAMLYALAGAALAQMPVVPIASNSPSVVLGMDNRESADDLINTPILSSSPSGTLPLSASPWYTIATFDTGAPLTVIGRDEYLAFKVGIGAGAGHANLQGNPDYGLAIGGAGGGVVYATPSDPLGTYITGLQNITNSSTVPLSINAGTLKGAYNQSIVYPEAGDDLPTLIGTSLSLLYTTTISYSNPQILEYDGRTYRSPGLSLHTLGSVTPPARRIEMTLAPSQLGAVQPQFFPSFDGVFEDDLNQNPFFPTLGGSMFLYADFSNQGNDENDVEMILDTGSQATFVSENMAASLGFHVATDTPDFVVRLAGVTGTAQDVPGFFADQMTFTTTAADNLTLYNVPLVVYNLTDPRDGINILDGLIGMNLFADRDVTINPQNGNPYLGLSDPVLPLHTWNAPGLNGDWATTTNWSSSGTPDLTWIAEVVNPAGAARNANVNADGQANYLHVKGNGAAMDLRINNGSTLTVFNAAIIEDNGYVTLNNNSTLDALTLELRGGTLRGSGTVVGEVLSQGTISPGASAGLISIEGSFDQLTQGTLNIDIGGNDAGSEYDLLAVTGLVAIAGTLDVDLFNGYTPYLHQLFTIMTATDIDGDFDTVNSEFAVQVINNGTSLVLRSLAGVLLGGDANYDGKVNLSDLQILGDNWQGTVTAYEDGDFTGDGLVNLADLQVLGDNWGTGTSPDLAFDQALAASGLNIPEPASMMLLLATGPLLLRRRGSGRPPRHAAAR
ncbi:MAG: aspartyl protease family protein [Phycisphaeraceae bacterium]|nr:aspartyl protease family protein [Phycisphaeraceae bacterium]